MKILGLRNLFKTDLVDIMRKSPKFTIDSSLHDSFSSGKNKQLLSEIDMSQFKTPLQYNFENPQQQHNFKKNYLSTILLLLVQNRRKIRLQIVEQFSNHLNHQNYVTVDQILKDHCLNEQELQLLVEVNYLAYMYALYLTILEKLSYFVVLQELTIALEIESQGFNMNDLGALFSQNQGFGRQIQKTFEAIFSLVQNSKLINKTSNTLLLQEQLQMIALLKNQIEMIWNKFQIDLGVESDKALQDQTQVYKTLFEQLSQILNQFLKEKENQLIHQKECIQDFSYEEFFKKIEKLQNLNYLKIAKTSFDYLILFENKHRILQQEKRPKTLQLGEGTREVFNNYLNNFPNEKLEEQLSSTFNTFVQNFFNFSLYEKVVCLQENKNNQNRKPKLPKGTRDFNAFQMAIRAKAFNIIKNVFQRHGAVELDTPVFELKETLTGKYGEDSKLIYDLEDQGGEMLSLRYDLTVPFARYVALNGIEQIKRYHIAKVYRRDQPAMNKGRFREFYQCDFDIAGSYEPMLADAEVIKIMDSILQDLNITSYQIKINHRKLLDAMVELSGAPKEKFKQICSSIDKLDKESWSQVENELIEEKGLTKEMTQILEKFVQYKGDPFKILKDVEPIFNQSESGKQALADLQLLFKYTNIYQINDRISFDLSLARGLDYYTGFILEIVSIGSGVGSICGGGRYDELVGMFSGKNIPSCGASIGIERVLLIMEEKFKRGYEVRETMTEVVVASIGAGYFLKIGMMDHKMNILNELWKNDIKAEMIYQDKPKPAKQLDFANSSFCPFMVWIGEDEVQKNLVKIKCMYLKTEEFIDRQNLVPKIKELVQKFHQDLKEGKIIYEN